MNHGPREEPGLAVEKVSFRYPRGGTPALSQCTLTVRQGEFYGLLGPNGAGKTTLLSLCTGLLQPGEGRIHVLGHAPNEVKMRGRLFGLVPQEAALYERLTARENLEFFARLYGLRGEVLRERVGECLECTGLTSHADRLVGRFSGGMKRRLNLAAGLLNRPGLLFLDEPTVGVDAQSRNLIHEQLRRLHREGTTMLYTTHYLEEARSLCTRIGIVDRGRLLTEGAPDELLGRYGCPDLETLFLQLTGRELRDG